MCVLSLHKRGMTWLHTWSLVVIDLLICLCNFCFSHSDSFIYQPLVPHPTSWSVSHIWLAMAYHSFLLEPISCHAWNKDRTRKSAFSTIWALSVTEHLALTRLCFRGKKNGVIVWGLWLDPRWEKVFPVSCKSATLSERLFLLRKWRCNICGGVLTSQRFHTT